MFYSKSLGTSFISLWIIFTLIAGDKVPDESQKSSPDVALGMNNLASPKGFRLPRGKHTFIHMLSRTMFIDKTLLINEILTSENTVSVFTSPTRWGKTINLIMLKTFVEMEMQTFAMGFLPPNTSEVCKLFTEGKYHVEGINKIELENPLLITNEKYSYLINKYLSRYPVIHLEFPFGFSQITDAKRGLKKFAEIVTNAFEKHKYMVKVYETIMRDNDALDYEIERAKEKQKLFQKYLSLEKEISNITNCEKLLEESVRFLSQELSRHFDSKVFIFIDEFDELLRSKISDTYEKFLTLTLNDNSCVEKAVLMGVMPMKFESNLSISNVVYHHFLTSSTQRFFGITKKEMTLIHRFYQNSMKERKKIEYWYNGYQLYTNFKDSMHNLQSVRSFYENGPMLPYWSKLNFLGNIPLGDIVKIPGFSYIFSHLVTGIAVNITYETMEVTKTELNSLRKPGLNANPSVVSKVLKYMVIVGFLAIKNITFDEQSNLYSSSVRFPNHETATHLKVILARNLNETFEQETFELLESTSVIWKNFTMEDVSSSPELESLLSRCFHKLPQPKGVENLRYEDFIFHSVVMSIIASKEFDSEFINSEFPDILLVYKSRGIAIQIKYEENTKELENDQYLENIFQECDKLQEVTEVKIVKCIVGSDKNAKILGEVHPRVQKKRAKKNSSPSDSIVG